MHAKVGVSSGTSSSNGLKSSFDPQAAGADHVGCAWCQTFSWWTLGWPEVMISWFAFLIGSFMYVCIYTYILTWLRCGVFVFSSVSAFRRLLPPPASHPLTHSLTHPLTLTLTLTLALALALALTLTLTLTHWHSLIHSLTHSVTHSLTHWHSLTHTHSHSLTLNHTHTHTHSLPHSLTPSLTHTHSHSLTAETSSSSSESDSWSLRDNASSFTSPVHHFTILYPNKNHHFTILYPTKTRNKTSNHKKRESWSRPIISSSKKLRISAS